MADSFFHTRNQYDDQAAYWPAWMAEQLAHAAARRLVKLEGNIETSKRFQRVADVCAAAHVLPMEHWQSLPAMAAPDAPKPWWRRVLGSRLTFYLLGFLLGSFFARWNLFLLVGWILGR